MVVTRSSPVGLSLNWRDGSRRRQLGEDVMRGAIQDLALLGQNEAARMASDTLNVNVTANTAPTLTYQNQTIALNGKFGIDPATGPSDNGRDERHR